MKRVVKFTFGDGSVERIDADVLAAKIRDLKQRHRAVTSANNGTKGGRPATGNRPSEHDILVRFGELWLARLVDVVEREPSRLGPRARARARLVKEIASECGVTKRVVSQWVRTVLGEP